MKKLLGSALILFLVSCGPASDGDASTDTTSMPIDTGALESPYDTTAHVNTAAGTYSTDSVTDKRSDIHSSSSATKDTVPRR